MRVYAASGHSASIRQGTDIPTSERVGNALISVGTELRGGVVDLGRLRGLTVQESSV